MGHLRAGGEGREPDTVPPVILIGGRGGFPAVSARREERSTMSRIEDHSAPVRPSTPLLLAAFAGFALVAVGESAARAQEKATRTEEGWVSLFNGKDLEGWTPKVKGYPAGENAED